MGNMNHAFEIMLQLADKCAFLWECFQRHFGLAMLEYTTRTLFGVLPVSRAVGNFTFKGVLTARCSGLHADYMKECRDLPWGSEIKSPTLLYIHIMTVQHKGSLFNQPCMVH